LAIKNYPKPRLVKQPSGNFIGENLVSEKYPQLESIQLPYRKSLANNLASNPSLFSVIDKTTLQMIFKT